MYGRWLALRLNADAAFPRRVSILGAVPAVVPAITQRQLLLTRLFTK